MYVKLAIIAGMCFPCYPKAYTFTLIMHTWKAHIPQSVNTPNGLVHVSGMHIPCPAHSLIYIYMYVIDCVHYRFIVDQPLDDWRRMGLARRTVQVQHIAYLVLPLLAGNVRTIARKIYMNVCVQPSRGVWFCWCRRYVQEKCRKPSDAIGQRRG